MREIRAWESSYYTTTATAAAAKATTSKRTAILGMSGHSLPIDIEAAKHAGMNAFLLKPLHPDTLVELIAVLVNDSTNGSTTTSYHQSLQSTMQSSGSNSSTSLSPRKLRATTTVTLDSATRGLLSKEHFGAFGNISGIANNCDAVTTTNSSADNTNSGAAAAAAAADECALLKKQVALLQQGRKTVSNIRQRHNTLM
jgi:hypothetical protein